MIVNFAKVIEIVNQFMYILTGMSVVLLGVWIFHQTVFQKEEPFKATTKAGYLVITVFAITFGIIGSYIITTHVVELVRL